VIGRNRDVGDAVLEHTHEGGKYTSGGADFKAVLIPCGRQGVVVPEQLVRAVDKMNLQSVPVVFIESCGPNRSALPCLPKRQILVICQMERVY
jgi:hypothetical protein